MGRILPQHGEMHTMNIDGNELEKKAMDAFRQGDSQQGHQIQREFLRQVKESGVDHCSCPKQCVYHGNCIDCVIIHRGHQDHLPNCFRLMVNERISVLSALTEHTFKDPPPAP
jgi:hypothetical protein